MTDTTAIFSLLERFIKQRSGLDPNDYGFHSAYTPEQRREARSALSSDQRQVSADRKRALMALEHARSLQPANLPALINSFRAFSGRLELNKDGSRLSYTAGQYFPTEYRKAAACVLENYISDWKQAYNAEHPQTFTYSHLDDVRTANAAIGHHWFDRDTIRFFRTRIASELIAGRYFITSEQHRDDGPRLYSIREAQPDGTIDTIGTFQKYKSRSAARNEITALLVGPVETTAK